MSNTHAHERPAPTSLLTNRNFLLLWFAYGISAISDNFNDLAQLKMVNAAEGEQQTRLMALMMFGLFVPYLVLGPVAGWCADRFSRKFTMIFADLLRAGVVICFGWMIPYLYDHGCGGYTVMLTQMALGVLAVFFSPARQAMLPSLVRQDQLVRANGMIGALAPIGAMIGFLVGGYVVAELNPHWNFRVNAVTYCLSALLVLMILAPRSRASAAVGQRTGVLQPLAEGFDYVWTHRRVLQMILLGALFWGAAGVVYSCVPAIVKQLYGGVELDSAIYAKYGVYRALTAVGMIGGAVVMTIVGPHFGVRLPILGGLGLAAMLLVALAAVFAFHLPIALAGACLIGVGIAGAMLLITINATLQRSVPDSRRGRVFGLSDMTTMGAMVFTTGVIGLPPWQRLDQYVPYLLLITAVLLAAAAVISWRVYRRGNPHPAVLDIIWELARFYGTFWCRVRRDGPCTIPREGPVILAMNHTSGVDAIAIYSTCRHRVPSFLAEQRYYETPIAKWFMSLVNCVPIDRTNPGKSFLSACLRLMKSGGCLAIFPQGTYEPPDEPQPPAKPGVAVIALRTRATVIPCHISGATYTWNPFHGLFVRHQVRVRYGPPVDLSAFYGREKERGVAEEATEAIMQKVFELAPADA